MVMTVVLVIIGVSSDCSNAGSSSSGGGDGSSNKTPGSHNILVV